MSRCGWTPVGVSLSIMDLSSHYLNDEWPGPNRTLERRCCPPETEWRYTTSQDRPEGCPAASRCPWGCASPAAPRKGFSMTRRDFLTAAGAAAGSRLLGAPARTPNIVFILCDDLGFGDLGVYGSKIRTPNFDRLASEGVRFTNFCSADPVCSPSRAALLTGRYPTRVGVPRVLFPQDTGGLNLDETTLANVLKARGYRTMCIGKWHLGRPAALSAHQPRLRRILRHPLQQRHDAAGPDAQYRGHRADGGPRYAHGALHRAGPQVHRPIPRDRPSFSTCRIRSRISRWRLPPRFRGKSAEGLYGDVVEEIDWSVGEVMQALKQNGLEQDTLVMCSSDNGPWYQGSPGKLRGRKNTTYEGGVREPFIARWQGRIPPGRVCDGLASMMDVFPTVARLCGAALPSKPLDGIDIWPLLHGERQSIDRAPLLYFDNWDLQCARWMNWKLHIARHNTAAYTPAPPGGRFSFLLPKPELYNLASDPDESYDVAPENPQIVAQIRPGSPR